jgi:regulatory protein
MERLETGVDGRVGDNTDQVGFVAEWLAARGIDAPEPPPPRPSGRRPGPPSATTADPADEDSDADPESIARAIVVRKLAARACTRHELERALAKKAVPAEAAARVLDRMEELRLIDDATFAVDWVASRQQRRHLSARALSRELATRGVAREQIAHAVAGVDATDEYAAALSLARRRSTSLTGLPYEVAYRRLAGVLARRGFDSSVTTRVLSEVLSRDGADGESVRPLD